MFLAVQSLSRVWLFAIPWTIAHQASLSITNSWSPSKPMSIKSMMLSNHLILCRPLLLLPSIFPTIRVFSNESALCIRWPKYGVSASASVLPMNTQDWSPLGWTGWISLQSKWLKSLLQHHSSKASILQCTAFFIVQLSHPWSHIHENAGNKEADNHSDVGTTGLEGFPSPFLTDSGSSGSAGWHHSKSRNPRVQISPPLNATKR